MTDAHNYNIEPIDDGSVTSVFAFLAGGINCGIKKDDLDLAIVYSERDSIAAACFTRNSVKSAAVTVSMDHLSKSEHIKAVILNSGCANTSTGDQGIRNARKMAECVAKKLSLAPEGVLVCSTGRIGPQLPMAKIEAGIPRLVTQMSPQGGKKAAQAILTTDTVEKQAGYKTQIDGVTVKMGGMAKGSGMIAPNMATMLCVITTDITVETSFMRESLREAVDLTFNRINVDGDMSTNDTVILLSNELAGNSVICKDSPDAPVFKKILYETCLNLALQIVKDGEGATKLIEIRVNGAKDNHSARQAAWQISNCLLFKVALNGKDPNWGRLMSALGTSGIEFNPNTVDIYLNNLQIVKNSLEIKEGVEKKYEIWTYPRFKITVDLKYGEGSDVYYTCDISHGYIDINL